MCALGLAFGLASNAAVQAKETFWDIAQSTFSVPGTWEDARGRVDRQFVKDVLVLYAIFIPAGALASYRKRLEDKKYLPE